MDNPVFRDLQGQRLMCLLSENWLNILIRQVESVSTYFFLRFRVTEVFQGKSETKEDKENG